MASTYSNLKIQLMATGENSGTWGNITNTNLGTALEQAITGSATVAVNADTTLTLTDSNAAQDARALRLNLSGAGGFNLTVPDIQKLYLVNNGSLGTVTVKNSTGATVAVPASKTMWVYSTGTAVVDAVTHLTSLTLGSALPIASGGTGSTSTTYANLQTNVTGTLPIANGGTGSTSTTYANLQTNVTGTLPIANGGTGSTSTTYANLQTNVTGTLPIANGGTGSTSTTYANLQTNVVGTLPAANGGTGITSPGTSGNVLTSNGTAWVSQAAGGGFDSGTVMLFGQTAAPTGWTKNTSTGDNHALRVVTGTASSGGSVDFSTAFASQTPSGSVSISAISGSAGATTLSTPQIPSHTHTQTGNDAYYSAGPRRTLDGINLRAQVPTNNTTLATGGGSSHTHPFSFSSGSASFSGNAINLAVKYVDVIRATKD